MKAHSHQIQYTELSADELPKVVQSLIRQAKEAAEKAYAPYSHFKVGCAVLLDNGTILTGSNHENAAYPAGICAERAALSALDMTPSAPKVLQLAIHYVYATINVATSTSYITPCGICRQTILEVQQWQGTPIEIYMCSPDNHVLKVANANDLLPFAFGKDYLQSDAH